MQSKIVCSSKLMVKDILNSKISNQSLFMLVKWDTLNTIRQFHFSLYTCYKLLPFILNCFSTKWDFSFWCSYCCKQIKALSHHLQDKKNHWKSESSILSVTHQSTDDIVKFSHFYICEKLKVKNSNICSSLWDGCVNIPSSNPTTPSFWTWLERKWILIKWQE